MGSKTERRVKIPPVPRRGHTIYVDSVMYMGHGMDDRLGGKAKVKSVVTEISGGKPSPFVEVEVFPGRRFNWRYLGPKQKELQKEFKNQMARPDPDDRLEFNNEDPSAYLRAFEHQQASRR